MAPGNVSTDQSDLTGNDLLRHFLAATKYRAGKALAGASIEFGDFAAGEGTRSPCDLLRHMTHVIGGTTAALNDGRFDQEPPGPLGTERQRFENALQALAGCLTEQQISPEATKRLLQGPLADVMTHVGQLALLRRLAGSPIPGENFYRAAIDASDLAGAP